MSGKQRVMKHVRVGEQVGPVCSGRITCLDGSVSVVGRRDGAGDGQRFERAHWSAASAFVGDR